MSIVDNIQGGKSEGAKERAHRSNLFLAATFDVGGAANPVRIRNLSETGALLEGAALPAVGTLLILKRQEVEMVAGAWLSLARCGVAFEEEIRVGEWVSGKRGTTDFEPCVRGTPVADRRALSAGSADSAIARPTSMPAWPRSWAMSERLLDLLSDELAEEEPVYVQRHAKALQRFDLAARSRPPRAILQAEDREAAIRRSAWRN